MAWKRLAASFGCYYQWRRRKRQLSRKALGVAIREINGHLAARIKYQLHRRKRWKRKRLAVGGCVSGGEGVIG